MRINGFGKEGHGRRPPPCKRRKGQSEYQVRVAAIYMIYLHLVWAQGYTLCNALHQWFSGRQFEGITISFHCD